jgi:2-polyprenyl-3-methyl-5-hydroxy-6-metoxy-1,4-benzoquinol methylase
MILHDETKQYYDEIAEKIFTEWFNNPALLETEKTFIEHLPSTPLVLDLGCGTGGESKRLSSLGAKVIGIDFSEESIRFAKLNVPESQFIVMDILDMDFPTEYFDGVMEAGVLFHFTEEEQNSILRKLFSYLKPRGRFLSYYLQGTSEGTYELNVAGKKYKRFVRQQIVQDWIQQVTKVGFTFIAQHEFNVGSFKCSEYCR